jgi:hypothetical protein
MKRLPPPPPCPAAAAAGDVGRRAGRMSERGNCFPFLRKANGPERALGAPQFRRGSAGRGEGAVGGEGNGTQERPSRAPRFCEYRYARGRFHFASRSIYRRNSAEVRERRGTSPVPMRVRDESRSSDYRGAAARDASREAASINV